MNVTKAKNCTHTNGGGGGWGFDLKSPTMPRVWGDWGFQFTSAYFIHEFTIGCICFYLFSRDEIDRQSTVSVSTLD